MVGTHLFGEFADRVEPKFEYIETVSIVEEAQEDYSDVWENLVELGCGCWVWTGKHTDRGFPIRENVSSKDRWARYVQRVTWKLVRKEKLVRGSIENHCGRIECCNPSHYVIVY